MSKPYFNGRYISIGEILEMLRGRGLVIEDVKRAEHILSNVSYSRLKNYLIPLMEDKDEERFIPGATFEQAYAIYGFDRRIRELVFHEMEKIEISIRTHIAYATSGAERGYWFTNPKHFRDRREHAMLLRKIRAEIDRSDNDTIVRFRRKYSNEFPPSWITLEATSMGTLLMIYIDMNDGPLKSRIAEYYGLSASVFTSWLQHLVYVRNYCAHHNRLWNKTLSVSGQLPASTRDPFPQLTDEDTHHLYFTLCVMKYLINTVKPENSFSQRLSSLIEGFPTIETEAPMGFPEGWRKDPFWKL